MYASSGECCFTSSDRISGSMISVGVSVEWTFVEVVKVDDRSNLKAIIK